MGVYYPLNYKVLFFVLLIYVLPAVAYWAYIFASEPLPYDLVLNFWLWLLIFAVSAIISPVFILFGGVTTVVLGTVYFVMAYALLFRCWKSCWRPNKKAT